MCEDIWESRVVEEVWVEVVEGDEVSGLGTGESGMMSTPYELSHVYVSPLPPLNQGKPRPARAKPRSLLLKMRCGEPGGRLETMEQELADMVTALSQRII
jgi:hypothetical protein